MKILLVEPFGNRMGHFGLFAAHIAQEVGKLAYDVVLLSATALEVTQFLSDPLTFRVAEGDLRSWGMSVRASRLRAPIRRVLHLVESIWISSSAVYRALRRSYRESFDVIHLLTFEAITTAVLVRAFSVFRRIPPLVMHLNPTDFSMAESQNRFRGVYKLAARTALRYLIKRRALAVTVQGEWHREKIMRQLGCQGADDPPFIVVRPGTPVPTANLTREQARARLGIRPGSILFLQLGMLRRDKGIQVLLDAVENLAGDWQLFIAGAPFDWSAQSLAEAVMRSSARERIQTNVGYISESELPTYFLAADTVVFPYHGRNYPGNYGPMMLACAFGCPMIASDVGEMGMLIKERRLGFAVVPDNPPALRAAMASFLTLDPNVRQQMAVRARQLAEESSFKNMARKLSHIYASAWVQSPGRHVERQMSS